MNRNFEEAKEKALAAVDKDIAKFQKKLEQRKQFFESKKERKLEAYRRLAEKNTNESQSRRESSHKLADAIPFGQPILVGHHSERRHRKDLERINRDFAKSIEFADKAEQYERKISNLENPRAVSSDDPDAITKLKAKLAGMEQMRETTKGRRHEGWELSNLSANIRRVKRRIEALQAAEKIPDVNIEVGGVRVHSDKIENRLKIVFADIPSVEVRNFLKARGFRWSPYNKAWQRQLSNTSVYHAEELLKQFESSDKTEVTGE